MFPDTSALPETLAAGLTAHIAHLRDFTVSPEQLQQPLAIGLYFHAAV